MLYLLLAILSSFSIALIIKFSETRKVNRVAVLFFNYLVATVFSLILAASEGSFAMAASTLGFGIAGGFIWPASFFLLMRGIQRYGMSITGALARLSLSVPVVVALLFLGERLTPSIAAGLTLTFAAFFMINPVRRDKLKRLDVQATLFFAVLIITLGCSDVWMNIYKIHGIAAEKTMFLTMIFGVAGLITGLVILRRRIAVRAKAVWMGALLGLPNYFSSFLLLEALKAPVFQQQSAVVYSIYSASILVLTFTAGALLWREKVTRLNVLGAGAAIIAIVLLNSAA